MGRTRNRPAGDEGYTLLELLVGIVLAVLIVGGPLGFIVIAVGQSNGASSRAVASRRAEIVLSRLTRELRQAQHILNSSTGANLTPVSVTYGAVSSSVSFFLEDAGGPYSAGSQVTWTCTAGATCTRTQGGSTVVELANVTSATFTPVASGGATLASPASDPVYVTISLSTPITSLQNTTGTVVVQGVTNSVVVQDGAALRNYVT